MKSFAFWFFVALVAVAAVKTHHRVERPVTVRHAPTVIIHEGRGPAETHGIHVVQGNGHRTVTIDDRGVTVVAAGHHDDDDADDDRDRDGDDRRREGDRRGRVSVEGLPVPVVPGTRTEVARIEVPKPPTPPAPPQPPKLPRSLRPRRAVAPQPPTPPAPPAKPVTVVGRLSATEDRARDDARAALAAKVAEAVEPQVPKTWKVPAPMVDRLVREVRVRPHDKDYGTVYDAEIVADLGPERTAEIVGAYRREQTVQRLTVLGGLLAFVLVCLGSLSGYIRADEATKGYYTTRLRLAAAAGVGAAGVLIYQWVA